MSKIKVQISILRPQVWIKYNLSEKKICELKLSSTQEWKNIILLVQPMLSDFKSWSSLPEAIWIDFCVNLIGLKIQTTRTYYMDDWVLDFLSTWLSLKTKRKQKYCNSVAWCFFVYLIGLKIQNHKFDIAFSSDSEGFTWSGVDLVNVVVDLVTVVLFFCSCCRCCWYSLFLRQWVMLLGVVLALDRLLKIR